MFTWHARAASLPLEGFSLVTQRGRPVSYATVRMAGSALAGLIGLVALSGYAVGSNAGWRWTPRLPGIDPATALCLVLLALGMFPVPSRRVLWRLFSSVLLGLVALLLVVGLASPILGTGWLGVLPGPGVKLPRPRADMAGMPANTAIALLVLVIGEMLRRHRRPVASQLFASAALAILFVGVTGYLGKLSGFWGTVGLSTFVGVAALVVALLFGTPRHGFMRALTAVSEPGRLARILLASSTALLVLIGWVVSRWIDNPGIPLPADGSLLVYETAAVTALTWVMVAISTMRADRFDRYRSVAERLLHRTSTRDGLTGLLTRNRLAQLRAVRSRERRPSANLFIDLDRFRSVNEALGAEQGDRILKEVARRLVDIAEDGLVARIGGDEFAIFSVDMTLAQAESLGAAATAALAQPFDLPGRSFRLTASVGIAHTDSAGGTDLRQAADDAMYVAKGRGGNQAVVFTRSMHDARQQEAELEQDLHEALLSDDQLTLFYQPVVRVSDRQLLAMEALARWNHPRLGMVPPDRFIALAERTGLMAALGLKLMEMAIAQLAVWEAKKPGLCPTLNLNVSPIQFVNGDIVADLVAAMQRHGLPPDRLCIEVTESVFAASAATEALMAARKQGFQVSMDDFGVGYSTLSQLPRLPLTSVKLDRSFVAHAMESAGGAALFGAVTQLVHALGLVVVAEGVEDSAQFDLITRCGCDALQGYLVARPMRGTEFGAWVASAAGG